MQNPCRSTRHKAREVVLQALYWTESTGDSVEMTCHETAKVMELSDTYLPFVLSLGRETFQQKGRFDRMIAEVSEHWRLDRITRIDRLILEIALTELFCFDDIPEKVSLDEAIELSKRFSGHDAPAFVNGILDAVTKKEMGKTLA
ncbi:MAG: transcription antitermination factor NusB [Candidatus Latescibacteria bacterium]|nr:transcription antitermination factor NusB [Candidatus Latescibacterota bacterium]